MNASLPAIVIALSLGLSACGKSQSRVQPSLDATNAVRWNLPKRLNEISGLALSADERLFAHDDERGVIYQIDWHQGRLTKAFSLGDPPARADFEGIAIAGENFYLVTSDGVLYRATEGDDGAHVPYERIDTGTGARCEIEGLAYDARRSLLLLGCKAPRDAALKGRVAVFAWSMERRMIDEPACFSVPEKPFAAPLGEAHFNPSSIEVSRDGAHLYLLAGRQRALAEVDLDGGIVALTRLAAQQHRQPEGLTIGPDGELIIADEGGGGRHLQSTDGTEMARNKALILIHGRGFKPASADLEALWVQALRAGVGRDASHALPAFNRCRREFVYYGDEINAVLTAAGRRYDAALDLADLENTLAGLAALSKSRQFRREHYERLPGKTALKEFLADVGAPALSAIGLKERALIRLIPELADYWCESGSLLRPVVSRLCDVVGDAMRRGDDVVLISHCIGSVIAYDALWALSRGGYRGGECAAGKVTAWLTLGAPLGDESVKARLHGAGAEPSARHPNNILSWLNIAAEDDYVCHDDRLANDYAGMLDGRLISRIVDVRIYNLAVRYGRSNPHNVLGYLTHPRVSRAVANWLAGPIESNAAR